MADLTVIRNAVVITPTKTIDEGAIAFKDGKIEALGTGAELNAYPGFRHAEVIDACGNLVCPGFIDRHLHGGGGADTMDADLDALRAMSNAHGSFGVTAFCPATMAAPDAEIERALRVIAVAVREGLPGAQVIGAHIEGPCMSVEARGAHSEEYVRGSPPTLERLDRFIKASAATISLWTLAPELPGAMEFIRAAKSRGVKVSIGHTKASYADVTAAVAAGASSVTHLFNAMAGFHYRDAGGIMAVLFSRGKLMAELIADGAHVHPAALHVAIESMRASNIVLITDAMRPVGLPSMNSFKLPGLTVYVRDGRAVTEEGKLCGSLLTLNRAVKNVNEMLGRPLQEAIQFATINAARSLGIESRKGSLEIGKDADIVICDTLLNVQRTIVAGKTVHRIN